MALSAWRDRVLGFAFGDVQIRFGILTMHNAIAYACSLPDGPVRRPGERLSGRRAPVCSQRSATLYAQTGVLQVRLGRKTKIGVLETEYWGVLEILGYFYTFFRSI